MTQKQVLTGAALVIISASLSLLGWVSLSGELNYKSLRVNMRYLIEIRRSPDFKALYLQSSYDRTGIFSRDNIVLVPYAWNTNYQRIDINPGMTGIEKEASSFEKEMIFSDFQVSGDFIDALSRIPSIDHIVLTATVYPDNENYIQYIITAYDSQGGVLPINDGRLKQLNPCPPAKPEL